MKNRTMKQKITIAFGVVVACFFITVGALFYGMFNISVHYNQFYKNSHEAIVHVNQVKINMETAIQNMLMATIDNNATNIKQYLASADEYASKLQDDTDWFTEHYKGDMTLVNQFQSQLQDALTIQNKIEEQLKIGADYAETQAQTTLINEYKPAVDTLTQTLDQFSRPEASCLLWEL